MLVELRGWGAHQGIQFSAEFSTVGVKREIVDVVSEGVLEFVADGCDSEDDVGCRDGAGDGNPAEGLVELEGEEVDVEEDDLGDEDVVADWEGGGEDSFGVAGCVCHAGEGVHLGK